MKPLVSSWNWEAPVAELQQTSVHLQIFNVNPTQCWEKKKPNGKREMGFSSVFPHDAQILHCKN